MTLAPGSKLAHYELQEPIGKGGMGEVYRARDTKLDRDVAIKVLPEEFAGDEERLARFEREAKLLASLNHPNIASIFGIEDAADGAKALVLELVEGPTLADRIQQGPIEVDEALAIAKQIAEALEAGHEAGVIHRDLKPANIKIKEDSIVKVLDYGLAKALEADGADGIDSELSQSPTLTRQGTELGVILGTAAYMSPEQAKGKRVDKRTDVWAFGVVLYEMLTGRSAFASADVSETLASVIKSTPDWSRLPSETPAWLRKLLRRCLEKDRSKRLRDIGDALLDWNDDVAEELRPPASRPSYVLAGLAALVAGILAWGLKPAARNAGGGSVSRFSVNLPREQELFIGLARRAPPFAIAPDGRTLAYTATESGVRRLYMRVLDERSPEAIDDTDGALSPFFSPDGEWLGYFANNRLWKVALDNRVPIAICDVFGEPVGGTWSNDAIVFTSGEKSGLHRVSAEGGEPAPITSVDASANELGHIWPHAFGDHLLYTVRRDVGFSFVIAIANETSGPSRILVEGARYAIVAPSGHLVYGSAEGVYAAPFDIRRGEVTGPAVALGLDAHRSAGGGARFMAVSDSGALVYATSPMSRLTWVDRDGSSEPVRWLDWDNSGHVRLSLDGKRAAVGGHVLDLERGTTHRPGGIFPMWRPGSDELAVFDMFEGLEQLFLVPADGGRAPTRLLEGDQAQVPSSWHPDGRTLLYSEIHPDSNADLWTLNPEGVTTPFLVTNAVERNGRFSPDGRFVAYDSDESGQLEVYVRDFPEGARKWLISSGGGRDAVWSPSGRELFYRSQGHLMRVGVALAPDFEASPPEAVLEAPTALGHGTYDITPDGERFLMLLGDPAGFRELKVVLNWHEELKRLVPVE